MKTGSSFKWVTLLGWVVMFTAMLQQDQPETPISSAMVADAGESLIGLTFTQTERDSMLDGLAENLQDYEKVRQVYLENSIWPAVSFNPIPVGKTFEQEQRPFRTTLPGIVKRPKNLESVAFSAGG